LNIGVSIFELATETRVISNIITNCGLNGVILLFADDNFVENNTITHCEKGVLLSGSGCENNIVTNNNFSYNDIGVHARGKDNKIYYNNFVKNTNNAKDEYESIWYKFKLFGKNMGNYWDDYTGVDNDGDGIGDTPYDIPGGNCQDKYPLMKPYTGCQSNQKSQNQIYNSRSSNLLIMRLLDMFPLLQKLFMFHLEQYFINL
jgi:parallel beta-helix repeat protein